MSIPQRLQVWVLIILTVAGLIIGFAATPASACSCIDKPLADYANEAALVFAGQQTSREVLNEVQDNGAVLTFDVELVFKGDIGETVSVRTHAQNSACWMDSSGIDDAGVVVFIWRGQPSVNLCGSAASVQELETVFGAGVEPVVHTAISEVGGVDELADGELVAPEDSDRLLILLVVGLAAGVATVVVVTLRLRRS